MAIYNPKTDLVFKKLFGTEENKDLLMSLINSILPAHQQIVKLTLKNPYNVSDYAEGKLSILDIKAEDEKGIKYDIEMQIRGDAFYGRRILYYWAKMFGTQLDYVDKEDQKEGNSEFSYSELKKCIVISLMDFNFFKDERYQRFFMLKDAETNETTKYLDYLDLYFIELKKFKGDLKVIQTTLERWITFLNRANYYKDDNLPDKLAEVKEIKKASKTLTTMYFTEKERMFYEGQQKLYLDNQSILKSEKEKALKLGIKQGIEEGIKEGIKEGKKVGVKEGKIEVAKNLKKLGIPTDSIIEATGLSKDEIEKL